MYPHKYFELFPPFPRENKVFVAMSFEDRFEARWQQVIAPAIRDVRRNNVSLEPHRVDTRRISDSILTEILGGISNDLIIFADVTSLGQLDGKPVRSGNVMYEVGLAQAVRLPEEVLLFRSDTDSILFDVANVRINSYKPDENLDVSRDQVSQAIAEALSEVDMKRQLSIKAAATTIDMRSWMVLLQSKTPNGLHHFPIRNLLEIIGNAEKNASITRLLQIGALSTDYLKITPELIEGSKDLPMEKLLKYKPTPFGNAILEYAINEMGILSPEIATILKDTYTKPELQEPLVA